VTDIVINLVSQATTPNGQPAITISLDLTIGNTPNGDGSYTVTAASGTYVSTDASENATTLSMSLAPGSIDGADNELFLNGGAKFDLGGITFTTTNLTTTPPTPGDPNAATFAGSLDAATYTGLLQTYPQDVNLFYTGGTTILGNESFTTNLYGIDTPTVTYLTEPDVSTVVAEGTAAAPSSVLIENAVSLGTIEAVGPTPTGGSIDAKVTVGPTTLTGDLLEAQGAALIDVQAGATIVDSTVKIVDGGAIQFETAFAGPADFVGAGNTLTLSLPGALSPITGFQATDAIDFSNIAFASVSAPQFSVSNGDTIVSFTGLDNGQTVTETLDFVGVYANAIQLGNDGAGGTSVTTSVICFLEGTLIRTPEGESPVERLSRGDLVMTVGGEARPVAWIGRRTVSARFADPLRCWPIRVKAGALGDKVPTRDLLLSPDHALLVGDVLIHAGALVNGTSILRETEVPSFFVYYHVELEDHALILAENAPAETFVDNVDRLGFDNWAEHEALYPGGRVVNEMPWPRAKARRQVPLAIREALDERGRRLDVAQALAA